MNSRALISLSVLFSLAVNADNTIIEETLYYDNQLVSKVWLSTCDINIANADNVILRSQSANQRLLKIKVADKHYYAPSFALFEREEGMCELIIKGLLKIKE